MEKQQLKSWIDEYLKGTDYELITLSISPSNDILVEVDCLAGVDVDFCAELNRYLVEKLEELTANSQQPIADYSLEVGSVSLTDPFKTKMQYEKNLGHDVEVMVEGKRHSGQLVSVDDDTFTVDAKETLTFRYDEVKQVKYNISF